MKYMEAYTARMASITHELDILKDQLIELGWISTQNDDSWTFRRLSKDGETVVFGFDTVPYRWYISREHHGIIKDYDTRGKQYDTFPFTLDDILANARPSDSWDKRSLKEALELKQLSNDNT